MMFSVNTPVIYEGIDKLKDFNVKLHIDKSVLPVARKLVFKTAARPKPDHRLIWKTMSVIRPTSEKMNNFACDKNVEF